MDETIALHGSQRSGEIRCCASGSLREFMERFRLLLQDEPQQGSVLIGKELRERSEGVEPDFRLAFRGNIFSFRDRHGSLLVSFARSDADFESVHRDRCYHWMITNSAWSGIL